MTFAAFVLSTGRCGTQWLAETLAGIAPDRILVEHEPLHDRYGSRKLLGRPVTMPFPEGLPIEVAEHVLRIDRLLETRSFLECGHPCWSAIPLLASHFQDRIRIIHLTRHPVPTCCSWLTHQAFQASPLRHLPAKVLLSPFDEGAPFPEYRAEWQSLGPFEKCVYYWTAVNGLALELESELQVPWLRLRYEDLFGGPGLHSLFDFLELPWNAEFTAHRAEHIDRMQFLSAVWQDWRLIDRHPRALAVSHQLGYDMASIDEAALRRRYLGIKE